MIADLLRSAVMPLANAVLRDARCAARVALLRSTIALIAAIAFATGIVFCAWAAYSALAAALSPPIAGVIVGLFLVLAATLALWWVLARTSPDDRQQPAAPPVGAQDLGRDAAEVMALAERTLRRNAGSAVIGALVAGVVAGTLTGRRR